jgi:hypothetical protein
MAQNIPGIEWHRYAPLARWRRAASRALAGVMYLSAPLVLCAASGSRPLLYAALLGWLPLLVLLSGPFMAALVASADIAAEQEGLRLYILGPWRMFIPWQALRFSETLDAPLPLPIRLLAFGRGTRAWAVHVPGLSALAPVGVYLGIGRLPVFVITAGHDRQERLRDRLAHLKHPLARASRASASRWRRRR